MGPAPAVKRLPRPVLTPREMRTAKLAYAMGYYESPRKCTMQDIAQELGITKSAVYHRMSKVEREALGALLSRDRP
jgi:predicted DNA binding protein